MRIAWLAVPLIALAGAGCGSDGSEDADEIASVLDRAFVHFDAAACGDVFTSDALERMNFERDEDPLESCQDDIEPEDNADSIAVEDLSVAGSSASGKVVTSGGNMNSVAVHMRLVDRGGWRIDRVGLLDVLDHSTWVDALMAQFVKPGQSDITREQWRCTRSGLERTPDREYNRIYVDHRLGFMMDITRECFGDGTTAGTIEAVLERRLIDRGLAKGEARCMISAISGQIRRYSLRDSEELYSDPAIAAVLRAAAPTCLGDTARRGRRRTPPDHTTNRPSS